MDKQRWQSGQVVKVGFMRLRVVCRDPKSTDAYKPADYHMESLDGRTRYIFTPYQGLQRV